MNESGWRDPFKVGHVDETTPRLADQQLSVSGRTPDTVRAEPRQISTNLLPLFLELTGEETADEWARSAGLYIRHVRKTTKAHPSFSKLFNKLLSKNETWTAAPRRQKYFFNQIVAIHWRRCGWIWFTRDSNSLAEGPASRAFARGQRAKARALRREARINDPMPRRKVGRRVLTEQTMLRAFRLEKQLENYLRAHPSVLGPDLLIIGAQVRTAFGGRIDLLAIDAIGVIHIIELKIGGTDHEIVGQVTDYLYWVRPLARTAIIEAAARGRFGINLEDAFLERFGHPLPEMVNQTQVLTIIAAAIDLKTQRGMLAIRRDGLSTSMFRYVVQPGAVSLIPCCSDGLDLDAEHAVPSTSALRNRVTGPMYLVSSHAVHIEDDIRVFWQSQDFNTPIVLFEFIYKLYVQWIRVQVAEGLKLAVRAEGLFGRQLVAIVAATDEWAHVYVPTGIRMETLVALKSPPSTRTSPAPGYQTVAYMKNPVFQKSDTASW